MPGKPIIIKARWEEAETEGRDGGGIFSTALFHPLELISGSFCASKILLLTLCVVNDKRIVILA